MILFGQRDLQLAHMPDKALSTAATAPVGAGDDFGDCGYGWAIASIRNNRRNLSHVLPWLLGYMNPNLLVVNENVCLLFGLVLRQAVRILDKELIKELLVSNVKTYRCTCKLEAQFGYRWLILTHRRTKNISKANSSRVLGNNGRH